MTLVLNDIKYFKIVAETLNVTRASEKIGLTQSALSYAIKRLENSLNIKLFIRLKNGMALTKSGEIFYKQSNKLINEWNSLGQLVYTDKSDTRNILGEYSFGIHPSVALYTLDKFLPELSKKYTKLRFNLVHGLSREVTEKVINWEIDFALAINPVKHNDLVVRKLLHDKVTLFGSDTAQNTLIFDPDLLQTRHILKELERQNIPNYRHITSSNLEVIAELISKKIGIGILPSNVASKYNLTQINNAPYYIDKLCLIYRHEKHQNKISQDIIDIIKTSFI